MSKGSTIVQGLWLTGAAVLMATAGTTLAQVQAQPANQPASAPAAQPGTSPAAAPSAAVPGSGGQLTLDKTSIDLGAISDEKAIDSTLRFTNTGNAPLEIKKLKGSCGCTVPQLKDLTKTVFQPGESGELNVSFNPKNKNGQTSVTVTIDTNDPAKPQSNISIAANVRPLVRIDPQVANIGEVMRGAGGGKTTIKVMSRIPGLKVTQATAMSPRLVTNVLEATQTVVDGETLTETPIEISVAPTAAVGQLNESITIRTTDESRTLNIYAMGEVVGAIQSSPQQFTLGAMAPAQAMSSQVRLSSRTGKAFKVLSIVDVPRTGASTLKVEFVEDASTSPSTWVLTAKGTAPEITGPVAGEFIIATDQPEDKELRVRYNGFVRSQAAATRPAPQQVPVQPPAQPATQPQ